MKVIYERTIGELSISCSTLNRDTITILYFGNCNYLPKELKEYYKEGMYCCIYKEE